MSNVATFYHNNAQVYPDVAYLAEFLAVNYSLDDQVIDGKFKDIGIEAVTLPDVEANWTVLENKRANTILYVGDTGKRLSATATNHLLTGEPIAGSISATSSQN